ncbi:MAG TPA: S28 family serine protease [Kofleriaceae bacterium]|nr:S28 family serine protease [Kofleriaceae bacterium]
MQRLLATLVLAAGCGAQIEDDGPDGPDQPEPPVAAVCDEAELPAELSALANVTSSREVACGQYVAAPARCFDVTFRQPISATNPATYDQHLLLTHRGCNRPMVVADWGYSSFGFFDDELATLFHANTLWLEHRYQGESVPAQAAWDWSALTIENGANDTHRVIEQFKTIYGANWVSTGASKGGITAAYHYYFFPHDLDGSIPYVAPASRARVDNEYQSYITQHMTSSCAQKIRDTQVAALTTRHNAMITRLTASAGAGAEESYLQSMAGYLDWSFWQYYGNTSCAAVPTSTTTDDNFFAFLRQASGYPERLPATDARSDGALSYEWLTEQGFAQQLSPTVASYVTDPSARMNMEDAFKSQYPDIALPAYNGQVTRDVRTWAKSADNLLLIYGELDPWSGGAMDPPTKPSSRRYFVPGANHGAQIAALPTNDRSNALTLASLYFGEQADVTALPRAIAANAHRAELLARAAQYEAVLVNGLR